MSKHTIRYGKGWDLGGEYDKCTERIERDSKVYEREGRGFGKDAARDAMERKEFRRKR